MRLEGKVAIITGASSGIGWATAKLFCKEGATVVAAARRSERLKRLKSECEAEGYAGKILTCKTDVREPAQIEHLFDFTKENCGALDILVNNAGRLDGMRPVHLVTDEVYDMIYETNMRSYFIACRRAVNTFLEQESHGCIINMASAASVGGLKGGFMYVTTKHAILGMTKNIACSYYEKGIRCNCIMPANIKTEINKVNKDIGVMDWQMRSGEAAPLIVCTDPSKGEGTAGLLLGKPSDVAQACLFLADEKASRYVSGAALAVDASFGCV